MKTLQNHIEESQLVANIVRSEINHGRTVYLVVIEGTDRTMVTSQPSVFGGKKVDGGIGAIAIEGEATWRDTYSTPIDEVSSVEMLPEWKMVDTEEESEEVKETKTVELINEASVTPAEKNYLKIAFEQRMQACNDETWKSYYSKLPNPDESLTKVRFEQLFDAQAPMFKIVSK